MGEALIHYLGFLEPLYILERILFIFSLQGAFKVNVQYKFEIPVEFIYAFLSVYVNSKATWLSEDWK
jgi:hypothetical protein